MALACGFSTVQYMHLVFKRELGCTPRAYRDRELAQFLRKIVSRFVNFAMAVDIAECHNVKAVPAPAPPHRKPNQEPP